MADPPSKYAFRSTMFGGPLIVMQGWCWRCEACSAVQPEVMLVTRRADFGSWSHDDIALGQAMSAEWKQLRDAFWNTPGTRVQHLLPPAYPPSYFPEYMTQLRNDVTGGAGWDAIQAVSAGALGSVVFVFRANLGADNITLFPRGLSGQTLYNVASRDYGWTTVASGDKLMAQGLNVAMCVRLNCCAHD